ARIAKGGATLHVARAVVELGAGLHLGALPLSARLTALRGEVHASGRAVPIAFTPTEAEEPSWVHGEIRAGEVTLLATVKAGGEATIAADVTIVTAGSRGAIAVDVDTRGRIRDARITGNLAVADV